MVPARTLNARNARRHGAGLLLVVLLAAAAACKREAPQAAPPSAQQSAALAAFQSAERDWRAQRAAGLTRPDGWTTLVGLHWIDLGAHYVGSAPDNGIRIATGPAQLGMLDLEKDGQVRFVPAKDAASTLDGKPFARAARLRTDADPDGPSVIGFNGGKGQATVIERAGRYALRVKDADAPTRSGFAGLDYWPADPSWRIAGKFVPHKAGRTLDIASVINTIEPMPNPGAIEFERGGKRYRLEALDEGDGGLSLIFADRTNGHGSYGAGRFLDADQPDADGRVLLDFNRSYNPPCAFTAYATCPLPPPENRLDLAVTAGEKIYAHSVH